MLTAQAEDSGDHGAGEATRREKQGHGRDAARTRRREARAEGQGGRGLCSLRRDICAGGRSLYLICFIDTECRGIFV